MKNTHCGFEAVLKFVPVSLGKWIHLKAGRMGPSMGLFCRVLGFSSVPLKDLGGITCVQRQRRLYGVLERGPWDSGH